MSFSYLKEKFKKKSEKDEIEQLELALSEGNTQENPKEQKEDEEKITLIMNRINEIENELPRIKVNIDTLKSQIQELRDEIEKLDKTIKDVMMLYEVVSQEINPFRDLDSENPIVKEIHELKQDLEDIRKEIAQIRGDLKLLAYHGVDLDKIIYEAISEGET
ncbi:MULTISPECIES: flagella accessory protein C [Thermococcus]|uniref:Archaeal flagella-related protein C n=1 Tax=Thermococcus sibiricus TaxID=172049 RepID=A0A101EMQ9_9EURY|nr:MULTISPECIES: flagella accessory protein C [Thermococcus]KUK18224.1 MAG: Archaeal flagella-related protein C [Thermococcus sibiricus]MBC7095062.1 flagellar protein FlaC [Thermococcus sp.]